MGAGFWHPIVFIIQHLVDSRVMCNKRKGVIEPVQGVTKDLAGYLQRVGRLNMAIGECGSIDYTGERSLREPV